MKYMIPICDDLFKPEKVATLFGKEDIHEEYPEVYNATMLCCLNSDKATVVSTETDYIEWVWECVDLVKKYIDAFKFKDFKIDDFRYIDNEGMVCVYIDADPAPWEDSK